MAVYVGQALTWLSALTWAAWCGSIVSTGISFVGHINFFGHGSERLHPEAEASLNRIEQTGFLLGTCFALAPLALIVLAFVIPRGARGLVAPPSAAVPENAPAEHDAARARREEARLVGKVLLGVAAAVALFSFVAASLPWILSAACSAMTGIMPDARDERWWCAAFSYNPEPHVLRTLLVGAPTIVIYVLHVAWNRRLTPGWRVGWALGMLVSGITLLPYYFFLHLLPLGGRRKAGRVSSGPPKAAAAIR